MGARIIDSASFLVMIFPKNYSLSKKTIYVYNIKNYAPTVLKHGKNGPFKETIFVDGLTGSINITTEIKSEKLSSDYPPEVYFEFVPHKVEWSRSQYKAAGTTTDTVPHWADSLPFEVNFIANGLPQTYNIYFHGEKYKLIVTQYNNK